MTKEATNVIDAAEYFLSNENRQLCPFLYIVFKYWDAARAGKFAPKYANIEISHLPMEMIPHCAVVDVTPGGSDFIYRYWGTSAADYFNKEMTGKSIQELPTQALCDISLIGYRQVFEAKTALVSPTPYGQAYNLDTHETILRLPMSSNGIDVDVIMTVVEMAKEEFQNLKNLLENAAKEK